MSATPQRPAPGRSIPPRDGEDDPDVGKHDESSRDGDVEKDAAGDTAPDAGHRTNP